MRKISNHILPMVFMMVLIMNISTLAQGPARPASMIYAPEGSYTKYFKLFDAGAAGMPKNAVESAKGGVALETARYLTANGVGFGSGFLLRTGGGKDVCLLTAGHVVAYIKGNPKVNDKIPMDLYFNYLGRDNNGRSETVSGVNTRIPGARLAAYNWGNVNIGGQMLPLDFGILLLDKKMLPQKTIRTLGHDLTTAPAANQPVYGLGHSNAMPLCIWDYPTFLGGNSLVSQYSHSRHINVGKGFSGGPLFLERTVQSSDPVIGLFINVAVPLKQVPANELIGKDDDISYADQAVVLRLSYIADQIRTICHQTAASQRSLTDEAYLEPEDIDNTANWNAFQVNVSASSLSGLSAASSTEYTTENPGSKLVRAKTLTMNFAYQASAASQNLVSYILAAETSLESGFSINAASNTEFSVYAVVSEPATAGTRIGQTGISEAPPAGTIYPNPSSNGVFTLAVPREAFIEGRDYTVQVFSLDGRLVYQSSASTTAPNIVDIHDQQRGKYIVTIKDGSGNVLLTKSIVY